MNRIVTSLTVAVAFAFAFVAQAEEFLLSQARSNIEIGQVQTSSTFQVEEQVWQFDIKNGSLSVSLNGQVVSDLVSVVDEWGAVQFEGSFFGGVPLVRGSVDLLFAKRPSENVLVVELDVLTLAGDGHRTAFENSAIHSVFSKAAADIPEVWQFAPSTYYRAHTVMLGSNMVSGSFEPVLMGNCDCADVTGSFCTRTDCDDGTVCGVLDTDAECEDQGVIVALPAP